uniref:CCHC-type domain-containing protein n=1 Tax=Tanacetum cinerariifolium TaxID=118510 RepID=A0A6L2KFM9_TANCI|nr:hypothetical protein [Tanacetum cinerariifolium]
MAFLSVVASRFPPSNNQLRTSSNPRNQATIQDGRVTVQQIQGRQNQSYAGTGNRGIATTSKGNVAAGQPRVMNCYNCQGEGHMARQCTHPKRPRNGAWFKEKLMLAEAQEASQILDEKQLAFLADPDAYDLDCDNLSSAIPVSMANLSSYDPKVLLDVPYSDSYPNDMISQDVQEMQYYEQTHVDDFQDNEIHSGSNIIMYSQYLQESQDAVIQDTNPSTPNDLLVLSLVEQMTDHVAHLDKENQANKMFFYDDTHKQALGYQNLFYLKKAQRIQPILNDGSVIAKEHVVISVTDDEETLILKEESRSKMLDKQNDPISIEKKIKISLIDHSKLNKIKEDFRKRFVTQKEVSAEQAFWLKHSSLSKTPVTSHTPVRIEAPSELPKMKLLKFKLFFNQMKAAVDQCSVDNNVLKFKSNNLGLIMINS